MAIGRSVPLRLMPLGWDLLFILPNLSVPKPSPFDGGALRIIAGDDPIVSQLRANPGNATGRQMLQAFEDQFGNSYSPGCLAIGAGAPGAARTAAAIRAFRNCCAVATILTARTGGSWQPSYSDHFDLYPLAPGKDGRIITNDAIVLDGGLLPRGFAGQSSPLIRNPSHFRCQPSKPLLGRLVEVWQTCYLKKAQRRGLLRMFRSLEIAFHALRFPTDSLLSVHEVGLRIVLWVSAFEVLLYPKQKGAKVNLATVLDSIEAVAWRDNDLKHRRYPTRVLGVKKRAALPAAIYFHLYRARNDFAHGNNLSNRALRRARFGLRRMVDAAPLLYRAVLEQQLDVWLPSRVYKTADGKGYLRQSAAAWANSLNNELALLEAIKRDA